MRFLVVNRVTVFFDRTQMTLIVMGAFLKKGLLSILVELQRPKGQRPDFRSKFILRARMECKIYFAGPIDSR
jgi:hypothetical protein